MSAIVEQEEAAERFSDQMKNYISKCRARFIQGTMNITDYDSYVKQVKDLGADEYIENMAGMHMIHICRGKN